MSHLKAVSPKELQANGKWDIRIRDFVANMKVEACAHGYCVIYWRPSTWGDHYPDAICRINEKLPSDPFEEVITKAHAERKWYDKLFFTSDERVIRRTVKKLHSKVFQEAQSYYERQDRAKTLTERI